MLGAGSGEVGTPKRRGRVTDDAQMVLFIAEGLWRELRVATQSHKRRRGRGLPRILEVATHAGKNLKNEFFDENGDKRLTESPSLHGRPAPGDMCLVG